MKRALSLPLFLAAVTASTTARADYEAWLWLENRVPVLRADTPSFPRIDLRLVTDVRLNGRSGGLAQSFFRVGPLFYLTNFLMIGVHGTIYADRLASGAFDQEARFELEPNLFGRLGDFTFNDRNRFEARFRESGTRYRYRNQLRINYAPKGARWIPFIWDELLVDLSGLGVNQNRAQVGLGRQLWSNVRLDVGVMLRSREEAAGWVHDRIANVYLYIDVPPLPAPPRAPPVPPRRMPDPPIAPDLPTK
ncbi:DUF2490 domain-containing protein [Polyangium aurulentum]|uniref:DUF2490 domain-containing protein n=1 Tax=Polyangium aurulentum TaxID=2567896 RepID=UPI0010AE3948|nr:DUF2490 domain-containing protein [Polyangium aurulentum]UQA63130.1 DUF2490 domain-containing protein [Polyangium aurulentum]